MQKIIKHFIKLGILSLIFSFVNLLSAADLSLQIDFIDSDTSTFVGSTYPSPKLQSILDSFPEFTPLKDLKGDPHDKDIPLKPKTITVKANFQMTGVEYADAETAKSEYKRFRTSVERKLLLNLFALSNHPAEILSQKDVSDKQKEKILFLETSLFTPQLKEDSLEIDEDSSGLLKSSVTGLETGWQIVGTFKSELKVVTGYLKMPQTEASK